jgi:hypothetical protein
MPFSAIDKRSRRPSLAPLGEEQAKAHKACEA